MSAKTFSQKQQWPVRGGGECCFHEGGRRQAQCKLAWAPVWSVECGAGGEVGEQTLPGNVCSVSVWVRNWAKIRKAIKNI